MIRLLTIVLSLSVFLAAAPVRADDAPTPEDAPTHVKIDTSKGAFIIELDADNAPASVANFLEYATSGHYDRTIFHRVVKGFVVQGGGYNQYFRERVTRDPVPYEGDNGLSNKRGTIAMARTNDPNSAQAQWYVNLKDNSKLDHRVNDLGPIYGYAVFGAVVDGMDVVDAIGAVATGSGGPFRVDVPVEAVVINRVDPITWPDVAAE
ncbi:MAG: peptidylprolyl isomerase [Pseudomonadota bacterium]